MLYKHRYIYAWRTAIAMNNSAVSLFLMFTRHSERETARINIFGANFMGPSCLAQAPRERFLFFFWWSIDFYLVARCCKLYGYPGEWSWVLTSIVWFLLSWVLFSELWFWLWRPCEMMQVSSNDVTAWAVREALSFQVFTVFTKAWMKMFHALKLTMFGLMADAGSLLTWPIEYFIDWNPADLHIIQ